MSVVLSGGTNHEGTKLPAIPGRAIPIDERVDEHAGAVVVAGANRDLNLDGSLANETPQVFLRSQEARLEVVLLHHTRLTNITQ